MKDLSLMRTGAGCTWLEVAIISDKANTAILGFIKYAIYERYREFDDFIANYQTAPKKSGISFSGQVLKEFYERPPVTLRKLLKARRTAHALDVCPYCGFPLAPETLDHFLPKEDWPEYAIFSDNLVPQCRGCAPIKSARYFGLKEKQSLFLHPMYSAALSTLRFKIDVKMEELKVVFSPSFSISNNITDDEAQRVSLHLKNLQVRRRIVDYCNDQYRHWIRVAQSQACDIKAIFQSRLSERECNPYPNDWATAFYQGVLNNADAIADLEGYTHSGPSKPKEEVRFL